jgi:hypothetical protein
VNLLSSYNILLEATTEELWVTGKISSWPDQCIHKPLITEITGDLNLNGNENENENGRNP